MSRTDRRRAARQSPADVPAMRGAAFGFLLASLLAGSAHAAAGTGGAETFVKAEAASATAVLADRSLGAGERVAKFEKLIAGSFDVEGVAVYVCGSAWTDATAAQKQRFRTVFKSALARIYADRLRDYSGEKVEVTDARASDGGVVVTTAVTGGNSRDTRNLEWNVVQVGKHMKLFDVVIDGVSTAEMTRDDYAGVLDENGGDIEALTARLSSGSR